MKPDCEVVFGRELQPFGVTVHTRHERYPERGLLIAIPHGATCHWSPWLVPQSFLVIPDGLLGQADVLVGEPAVRLMRLAAEAGRAELQPQPDKGDSQAARAVCAGGNRVDPFGVAPEHRQEDGG